MRPRAASAADLRAVVAVVRAAFAPQVARIGREPAPMGDDYGALIAAGHVAVVERSGAVRGVLVLLPGDGVLLLATVAVAPEAQGTGVGRALMLHAEGVARAAGLRAVRLYANAAIPENVALYARLGYRETHRAEEDGFRRVYILKGLD